MVLLLVIFVGCGALGIGGSHVTAVPSEPGDHPLVGVWEWTTDTYLYIFNADGSGSRGAPPLIQQFTWQVDDAAGHLNLTIGNTTELWYKAIENNVLTINSRQISAMRYSYNRRAGS